MDNTMDQDAARGGEDRPRGVSKNRLADLDLKPKLSIFWRPDRNVGLIPVDTQFPREAAILFCSKIESDLKESDARSYIITGGKLRPFQRVLDWIKKCVESQSIEKFIDLPEPKHDPFTQTIDVLLAAEELGVPAGSLSYFLRKRLHGCARKHMMRLDQVRELYDVGSAAYHAGLQGIACASLFNAWWDHRLDATVNPQLMEALADMRDEIRELDDDLHEAFIAREQELIKKWDEKKLKKAAKIAADDAWNDEVAGACNTADTSASDELWIGPRGEENFSEPAAPAAGTQKEIEKDWVNIDAADAETEFDDYFAGPTNTAPPANWQW